MSIVASSPIHDLAKAVCRASEAHLGVFFEELRDGLAIGDDLYADIEGRPADYLSANPDVRDRITAAQAAGGDLVRTRNPGTPSKRRHSAATQLELEDQIGRRIAQDPPFYVRRAIGGPPQPTTETSSALQDPRWWTKSLELREELTPRQYWERVAGSYVALVEGRCDGDPGRVRDARRVAIVAQHTIDGQSVAQHFQEVARAVSTLGLTLHVA